MSKKPKSGTATNNDSEYYNLKINLRINSLPNKKEITVLECFAGEGKVWDSIEKLTDKKINRFRIDINEYKNLDFLGNSLQFIKKANLKKFDIIDLDSWGSPVKYLEILFKRKYKGIIHCTYCIPMSLNPDKILAVNHFKIDHKTILLAPSLFSRNIGQMIESYLIKNGIKAYFGLISANKNYFYFLRN